MTVADPTAPDRILLVEDDPLQAAVVTDLLALHGYAVSTQQTLGEARAVIRDAPPDLLLLDRILPDGDGAALCRELKAEEATREIQIIILTARDRVEDRVEGLLGGADDYILKPFHPEELLARVHGCLRTLSLQRELKDKAEELAEKNQELVETQTRLIRAERLAAIGEIGLAIRHEINNPLGTILGHAELLLAQPETLAPDVQKKLAAISRASLRIRDVVKRLEVIRDDRAIEYLPGVSMTDLRLAEPEQGQGEKA
ncbi:MAG: response regulator [candidate division NC10 bacterium]|nr:response regulator [candidate division NC10 bacterium]